MTQAQPFPIGAQLEGGLTVTEHLRGEPARGMYRAAGRDGGRFLVTCGTVQQRTFDELRKALLPNLDGVSGLVGLQAIKNNEREHHIMIEVEPEGDPSSQLGAPLAPSTAAELGLDVVAVLRRAHASGHVLRFLRPELVYAREQGSRLGLTGIAPRAEDFLRTARPPSYGVPPMFDGMFCAPEVSAMRPSGPPADVFALGAVLGQWITGEHPFQGNDMGQQMLAIHANKRRPWKGPQTLRATVDRACLPRPEDRITLDRMEQELQAARAN